MAIKFVVGDASDVFPPQFAATVRAGLASRYPQISTPHEAAYHSEEVAAGGWLALQRRVGDRVPQLAGMDPYQAVYVPGAEGRIELLSVPGAADPLHAGSVETLHAELGRFAAEEGLPSDDLELMQLAARYLEDDDLYERDLDLQLYVQLMLSLRQALARGEPLWVST